MGRLGHSRSRTSSIGIFFSGFRQDHSRPLRNRCKGRCVGRTPCLFLVCPEYLSPLRRRSCSTRQSAAAISSSSLPGCLFLTVLIPASGVLTVSTFLLA